MQVTEIKSYLKKHKITYEELSIRSGIPVGTLKNIFSKCKTNPRLDTMQAIEKALNLSTPLEWTEDDIKNGVVLNRPEEDPEWRDLRLDIIFAFGEEYFINLKKLLHASVENSKKNNKKS